MTIVTYSKFLKFKEKIFALPPSFEEKELLQEDFFLTKDEKKKIEIYYAPFEYVNEEAQIVIVGITPGMHQMKKSYSTVRGCKGQEISDEEILHEVKKQSSFEGTMRKNLVGMLDALNLHQHLGISTCMELFGAANHLVHTTSVLVYPVFYKGKNFNGSTPNMLKTKVLYDLLLHGFARDIVRIKSPLIIPLGVNVTMVLDYLVSSNIIRSGYVLKGFPHPSGGNGHRHRQFAENKEKMSQTLANYFSDLLKEKS
jgi:hypothetical protein